MKRILYVIGMGILLVLFFLGVSFFSKDHQYAYWIKQFEILSLNESQDQTPFVQSGTVQKIALSYPILDGPASFHFCQSGLYARFNVDDSRNKEIVW